MNQFIIIFLSGVIMLFSCKQTSNASKFGNLDPTKVIEDSTEFEIPSFVDPNLVRLDFEKIMLLGSNPKFTFDFPIKDKDGKVLSREEVSKVTYQTKNLMDMYANENGKVLLGVIRPGSPQEFAMIEAISKRYYEKLDSFKRLDSINNK